MDLEISNACLKQTVLSLLKCEGKCVRKQVIILEIFVSGNQNNQSSCVFLRKRIVKKVNVVF